MTEMFHILLTLTVGHFGYGIRPLQSIKRQTRTDIRAPVGFEVLDRVF